ncbi:MAG: polynucleotide adenylyltransferase PcnB [Planctomycetota bacterium]
MPATQIDPAALDRDARRVVGRLQAHGHEAYFVGGCVRDLLIGRRPKDFDIATDATPQEIKRLFRNGRIIGRRFRLVHVFYGDHVIETSTFRAAPRPSDGDEDEDLLIVEDNEYGSAREDAQRRDFTVNALFFDPSAHEIVDHVGGLADVERRVLRTIGDPQVRLAEDPVRILRAIKFSTRLDFEIDDPTWDAMCDLSPHLERSAPPRVLEEILRLLRSGTALGAVQLMRDCGALEVLLPQLDDYLGGDEDDPDRAEPFWNLLAALDGYMQRNEPSTAFLLAALFAHPFELRLGDFDAIEDPLREPQRAAWDVLEPVAERSRLARRDLNGARRILAAQLRFTHPPERFSPVLFARSEEFPEALDLFALRAQARGVGRDQVEAWRDRQARALEVPEDEVESERKRTRGRKRRKRRRRRPRGE